MSSATVQLKAGGLSSTNDGIIYVTANINAAPDPIKSVLTIASSLDEAFSSNVSILPVDLPGKRLIFSPVGKLSDYDDVRSFAEAAVSGVKRALTAGVKAPLLILPSHDQFPSADLVTLLGALEAFYVPIQLREDLNKVKCQTLLVTSESGTDVSKVLELASILEEGRVVARDIGGGDPERMAAPRIQDYVENVLDGSNVKIEVIDQVETLEQEYPLFAAVNRAASVIERHRGRVMYLRYDPEGKVEKTLYLVGKGITFDTGGADVKTGGAMLGMSRDKCGAAAVAGFLKVVSRLKPTGLRVVGALCLARNSIGENSYVVDEVLTSRAGARVRVTNTDAEGRMVMADVLCKLKEEAIKAVNPHLFTIATLTGHAVLTVGPYSIAVDNSAARGTGQEIQAVGDELGDLFEVSTLRREDFKTYGGRWEGDDTDQSSKTSSVRSERGHQGPAAFLNIASGLNKHGLKAATPLKYTHIDIAGSAGDPPGEATGAPIIALYGAYLRNIL